jgi:hypothetical protein
MNNLNNTIQKQTILLFSNFSQECKKFRSVITPEMIKLFEPICIDHPSIRKVITTSKKISVKEVPCLLEFLPDNTVAKYEGPEICIEWLKSKVQPQQPQQMQNQQQMRQQNMQQQNMQQPMKGPLQKLPTTPIDNLISRENMQIPQQQMQPELQPQIIRKQNSLQQKLGEIEIQEKYPDMGRKGPSKTAFRGTMEKEGQIASGIMSNRDIGRMRIDRGQGHDGMRSSLHELDNVDDYVPATPANIPPYEEPNQMDMRPMNMQQQRQLQQPQPMQVQPRNEGFNPNNQFNIPQTAARQMVSATVKKGKQPVLIEDLTPAEEEIDISLDDDPSGMGRGSSGNRGDASNVNKASKEKSNAIKRLAEQISSSRETEESSLVKDRDNSLRQVRTQALNMNAEDQ